MRLWITVNDVHYYDIGLRHMFGNENLSKTVWRFGGKTPRFLEDFIERYPESRITIRGWGIYDNEEVKRYVYKLLGERNILIDE